MFLSCFSKVRSIYHDLKNHLLVMESRQNTEDTRQMAENAALPKLQTMRTMCIREMNFLDIILKDKAAKAREKQIDFSAMVDFHGIDFMEALDISTIFGNAIDNAIEASENLPEYKRLITVKAERVRDMLLITIETIRRRGTTSQREPPRKTALCMALHTRLRVFHKLFRREDLCPGQVTSPAVILYPCHHGPNLLDIPWQYGGHVNGNHLLPLLGTLLSRAYHRQPEKERARSKKRPPRPV